MKIMVQWEVHPDKREEVFAAFAAMSLAEYQGQLGPTVTTLGRWHDLANARGVGVFETTDQQALTEVLLKWSAAVDFEFSLVHDDAEAHALVKSHLEA